MSLQEKINEDLKRAIATQNVPVKDLLRVVIGDFSRVGKSLTDDQVLKILKKMCEEAEECNNPGEIAILSPYIPKGISELTVKTIIQDIVDANDFTQKDTGKIMPICKKRLGKDFDGKMISKILKEIFI